jgi:hypothetical protein
MILPVSIIRGNQGSVELIVNWYTNEEKDFPKLHDIDTTEKQFDNFEGIYIVWSGKDNPLVLRIGYGNIRQQITYLQISRWEFFTDDPDLYITWGRVNPLYQYRIINYLVEKLKPKIYKKFPRLDDIQVNLPQILNHIPKDL